MYEEWIIDQILRREKENRVPAMIPVYTPEEPPEEYDNDREDVEPKRVIIIERDQDYDA